MELYEKIYLIGNGRIADNCLKLLHDRRKDTTCLIVEEEKFGFSCKFCERNQIPFMQIGREEAKAFLLAIKEPTLIMSAHNGYLFPKEVVEKNNLKILNMHISLLPLYRGMNAPTWEIFEQQPYAGTTWHEIDARIDTGGIIVQEKFKIRKHDTAIQVLKRSYELGVEMLKKHMNAFLTGDYKVKNSVNRTRLYQRNEIPNNGYLDQNWSVDKMYAFLRSMDYSGTSIMPLPKVRNEQKIWEIWRYRMIKNEKDDEDSMMNGSDQIIKFNTGEYCLICYLREAMKRD